MRRAAPASEGVVTLRSPEDPRGIYRLVRRLFEAISTESNVELQALLAEHSVARLAGGTTQSAFATWVRRFSAGDYALLKPEALYRETDVRVYTSLDIERLAEPPATVLRPAPEEVLVQVPLRTQMAGGKVLFGTTLELLLRTTNGGLLIAALAEDYQPE